MIPLKPLVIAISLMSSVAMAETKYPIKPSLPPQLNEIPQVNPETALRLVQLDKKVGECRSSYVNVSEFKDDYFDSLEFNQKVKLALHLRDIAINKCKAYEEAEYLKAAISHGDIKAAEVYIKLVTVEDHGKVLDTIDKQEIRRLSELAIFSKPIDPMTFEFVLERDRLRP